MNIYDIRNAQRFGPYDEKTLLSYVNNGQILRQDKACAAGDRLEETVGFYLKRANLRYKVPNKGNIISQLSAIGSELIFPKAKLFSKQLADNIEIQTASLTQKRVGVIDAKLNALQNEKSVLDNENAQMQEDVNNHPWVIQKSVTNSQQTVVVGGKMKTVNNPSVTTNQVANPKIETIKENNEKIKLLNDQEKEWSQKKLTVEEDTRAECKANVGFLEELETMFSIVMTRKVAGVFYLIFFALLMSLELFVVVSKMGDQECDYEMAIKGAQRVKVAQFAAAFGKVNDFKV